MLMIQLRYYATFKVKKFESLFYKINTCLQKATTCIGLQAEQIFSVNIYYTYFSILIRSDLVRFKQISCFSKIECSIIP